VAQKRSKPTGKQTRAARRRKGEKGKKQVDQQKPTGGKRPLKRIGLWAGVVLVLIVIAFVVVKITANSQPQVTKPTGPGAAANQTEGSKASPNSSNTSERAKGNEAAQITLIEYTDFQCSYCQYFHRITKKLAEELGDDFKLTFRHFVSRDHANALLAAKAAEAARLQDKFWEMNHMLFENQAGWAKMDKGLAAGIFVQYADWLNLDVDQFRRDLNSKIVGDKILSDIESGHRLGVTDTPTFFLNGKKIAEIPRTYEAFKDLILQSKTGSP
jgi:protein-disulfide isomerase